LFYIQKSCHRSSEIARVCPGSLDDISLLN
jgi:hypothetical protein